MSSIPFLEGVPLEVTPAEAAGIRKFLSSLSPGIYVSCVACRRFRWDSEIRLSTLGPYCRDC